MTVCNNKKVATCRASKKLCNPDTGRCIKGRNNRKKMTQEYQLLTVPELKDIARENGVRGYSGKTKAEIINLLLGTRLTKSRRGLSPLRD